MCQPSTQISLHPKMAPQCLLAQQARPCEGIKSLYIEVANKLKLNSGLRILTVRVRRLRMNRENMFLNIFQGEKMPLPLS